MKRLSFFLFLFPLFAHAQLRPFGHQLALYKDSSIFIDWAAACNVSRGYVNCASAQDGWATTGDDINAIGPAGTNGIVSLGDGGVATLTFNKTIKNGSGPDFAVFENGFPIFGNDTLFYLELAFVEVSSDGQRYVRFPSRSLTPTNIQIDNATGINPNNLYNLAGKYIANYGTPFDLEDLKDSTGIDVNRISHVRIKDVTGAISSLCAQHDTYGNAVNDPWPTPFASCGFDLDAVGVIHQNTTNGGEEWMTNDVIRLYPQPSKKGQELVLLNDKHNCKEVMIYSLEGTEIFHQHICSNIIPSVFNVSGFYTLVIISNDKTYTQKIIVTE